MNNLVGSCLELSMQGSVQLLCLFTNTIFGNLHLSGSLNVFCYLILPRPKLEVKFAVLNFEYKWTPRVLLSLVAVVKFIFSFFD